MNFASQTLRALAAALLTVGAMAVPSLSIAGPIVASNSTFSATLASMTTNNFNTQTFTANGGAINFNYGAATVTASYGEVSLGGSAYEFYVNFASATDLFPGAGGLIGGGFGQNDAVDLVGQFTVTNAYIRYTYSDGGLADAFSNLAFPAGPWSGMFAGDGSLQGATDFDRGVNNVRFVVQLQGPDANAVPEPASLALVGLGLAGIAAVRRRKQAQA